MESLLKTLVNQEAIKPDVLIITHVSFTVDRSQWFISLFIISSIHPLVEFHQQGESYRTDPPSSHFPRKFSPASKRIIATTAIITTRERGWSQRDRVVTFDFCWLSISLTMKNFLKRDTHAHIHTCIHTNTHTHNFSNFSKI